MDFLKDLFKGAAGPILGGIADIWGSSRDRDLAKKQWAAQSIQARVADAKAAGISPLYALGNSGMSPTFIAGQSNYGSHVKDIVQGIRDRSAAAELKAQAAQDHRAELGVKRAQEEALKAQAYRDWTAGAAEASKTATMAAQVNSRQDQTQVQPTVKYPMGIGKHATGDSTPAQQFEDEYGDFASWIYGIIRLAEDAGRGILGEAEKQGNKLFNAQKRGGTRKQRRERRRQ